MVRDKWYIYKTRYYIVVRISIDMWLSLKCLVKEVRYKIIFIILFIEV